MRLIALCLTLAACGSTTVVDLKATGTQTARYESTKAPMEFARCVIPIYDSETIEGVADPAQLRPTATGIEILKTGTAVFRAMVLSMITVDAVGEGSTIIGFSTVGVGRPGKRLRDLESVIRQCA